MFKKKSQWLWCPSFLQTEKQSPTWSICALWRWRCCCVPYSWRGWCHPCAVRGEGLSRRGFGWLSFRCILNFSQQAVGPEVTGASSDWPVREFYSPKHKLNYPGRWKYTTGWYWEEENVLGTTSPFEEWKGERQFLYMFVWESGFGCKHWEKGLNQVAFIHFL